MRELGVWIAAAGLLVALLSAVASESRDYTGLGLCAILTGLVFVLASRPRQ